MELLVVGHIYRDLQSTQDGMKEVLNGAPIYTLTAPTLGTSGTGIVTCVGQDFEQRTLNRMVSAGIDTSGLYKCDGQTTQILTTTDESGKKTQSLVSFAEPITANDFYAHHLESTAIYFSPVIQEIEKSCILAAARSEAIIAVDIEGYLRESVDGEVVMSDFDDLDFVLGYTTILNLDELTLSLITEEPTEQESVDYLIARGPPIVILMRGEQGSSVYTRYGRNDIPYVMPSRIIDSTGSDYVYMIGFLLEFLRTGGDPRQAGYFGATAASFSCEASGPFNLVSRYQVERRLRRLY